VRTPAGPVGVSRLPLFVLLLGSITAIGPLSIDLYLPAFPTLATELHATQTMVQLTLTACLIGLATGQAVIGPLSDAVGRRRPLLAGMVGYTLASVVCALAPNIEALTAGRFLQGFAGSAGAVLAQALLRDLVEGPLVASVLSRLILVIGVAPVLAPTLGGQILGFGGWRGLFWVLAGFGVLMTFVVATFVRETLPEERRQRGGVAQTMRSYRRVVADRRYVGYAAMSAFGFLAVFGYVAGSPFAFQDVHGVSPQVFGLLFGINGIGLVCASQLNARLVLRIPPFVILRRALPVTAAGGLALVLTTVTGAFGILGLAVPLFVVLSSLGLVLPNSGALALNRHPESAGTAAALVGLTQFVVGASAGPVIGAVGAGTAVPMAGVIAIGTVGLVVVAILLAPGEPRSRRGERTQRAGDARAADDAARTLDTAEPAWR
jgi:MFS transporter, DHA1 family, multidrug resistance protein